jgi:radical SAM protein with 4Fe4S-binding SPASM domain
MSLRVATRNNLADVIPLTTPYLIRIDPSNLCNFRCSFCPTGDSDLLKSVGRPRGMMEYDLFTKIIDDISRFDTKLKKLSFYKDGEPLLNKRLPDMIRYARSKNGGVAEQYWLTTNGSLLNPALNLELIDAGLDLIRISIESVSSEGYHSIAKVRLDYDKLRSNIADLFAHRQNCKIHVKIVDTNLSVAEKEKFYDDFTDIATSVHIDSLMGWSMSDTKDFTLGNTPQASPDGAELITKEVCPFPFYTLTINFDGTVSVCCVDWSHSTIVGDLKYQSIQDIWNGAELFKFRKMHLEYRRSENRACADCQYLNTLQDNIDDAAPAILSNLIANRQVVTTS